MFKRTGAEGVAVARQRTKAPTSSSSLKTGVERPTPEGVAACEYPRDKRRDLVNKMEKVEWTSQCLWQSGLFTSDREKAEPLYFSSLSR